MLATRFPDTLPGPSCRGPGYWLRFNQGARVRNVPNGMKGDPGPYSSFAAIAFHRERGTDELILKSATLAPDQGDRLTEVVAKEL